MPSDKAHIRKAVLNSGFFDRDWYRNAAAEKEVEVTGDPLDHFLEQGWKDLLDPGPEFSVQAYLERHRDVFEAGINPLVHYLQYGRHQGYRADRPDSLYLTTTAPTEAEWAQAKQARASQPPVPPTTDVIIPVYDGYDETLRCIHSVLSAPQKEAYHLIVVDDHGPDPGLRAELDRLAQEGLFQLVRTERNLGFVGACNLGMEQNGDRDVVLLNADTVVHNDWLDRMRQVARSEANIATVTPFSNNATICSYPLFPVSTNTRLECDDAELDRLAAEVNAGQAIDLPSAIGFCMYIKRACLDQVGLFNLEEFGKGYGEENDFSCRAAGHGWRNVLAPNIFVRHFGGISFGDSKPERSRNAIRKLKRLHPEYLPSVERFIKADPIAPARLKLDMARLKRHLGPAPVLFACHKRGGGTESHMEQQIAALKQAGQTALFLRSEGQGCAGLETTDNLDLPNLRELDAGRAGSPLLPLFQALQVCRIHLHSLVDFPDSFVGLLSTWLSVSDHRLDVTIHDYHWICPRVNLVDETGRYCGEPPLQSCETCIQQNGSDFGKPGVADWRARHGQVLAMARKRIVPDSDVARRLKRYFPGLQFHVRPHEDDRELVPEAPPIPHPPGRRTESRTIGLLGAIGPHKGSGVLKEVAQHAAAGNHPLHFKVIGYTNIDTELKQLGNVDITGPYRESDILDLIREADLDIIWFPAVWPETYSYTLSHCFRAGIVPVAFDLGAIARRIREKGWGTLLPVNLLYNPERITEHLKEMPVA